MISNFSNNKRIAKNTLILYVRMLFMMLVALYTSRVILNVLGVEDFGIYNVVGGLVSMFALVSGAISISISRFITFELGRNNQKELNIVFSSAIIIQIVICNIRTLVFKYKDVFSRRTYVRYKCYLSIFCCHILC